MQEKYEFTYQMTYAQFKEISIAILKYSLMLKLQSWNGALALLGLYLLGYLAISFFELNIFIELSVPIILPILYTIYTNNLLRAEFVKTPSCNAVTTLTFSRLNIQESCDSILNILPYKHVEFYETANLFGILHNLMVVIPIPKTLFENEIQMNEFRAFVSLNIENSRVV